MEEKCLTGGLHSMDKLRYYRRLERLERPSTPEGDIAPADGVLDSCVGSAIT